MGLKSRFLTISIKEQICITILCLNMFCILVILCICCSFTYEIIKEDYKDKKFYFYDKYKDYIESCFYFKNFCLLQYEEIIRRMQKQSWNYHQTINYYNLGKFGDNSDGVISYTDSLHKNIENKISNKENAELFLLCFWEKGDAFNQYSFLTHNEFCSRMYQTTLNNYLPLSNSIFSNNIYEKFKMPDYNIPIMNSPLFTNVNYSTIFSFNASKIHHLLLKIQNGDSTYINHDKLKKYFHEKVGQFVGKIYNMISYYFYRRLDFFMHMFYNTFNEIKNSLNGITIKKDPISLLYFSRMSAGYLSSINYGNSEFSLVSYSNDDNFYYCETNIIDEFLYFALKKLMIKLDLIFIPLYYGNNTLISTELCILFLLKQIQFQMDEKSINDLYKKIKKGESKIDSCFSYSDILSSQNIFKEIMNLNFSTFLHLNSLCREGVFNFAFNNNDYYYFLLKYPYPNYNILKEFHSEYLLLDQVNFYSYSSFKTPIKYANYIYQLSQNCFYLLIIIILYIWFICLFVNMIIFYSTINEWIEPITKLQDAVETSSLKDENVFIYMFDDIINELFATSKELLIGQINTHNNSYLNNLNILSDNKSKNELSNEKISNQNLILNNDIINHLLKEQQNMMDFSKNIKTNVPKNHNKENTIYNKSKNNNSYFDHNSNENLITTTDIITKDTTNKISIFEENKIKNEEKSNEPYKKLFRIAEYIYYQRNKFESHNILVSDNSTVSESMNTKSVSKDNKSTLNNPINLKSSIIRSEFMKNTEQNKNIYVNMLDEESMSYLWYMEAKKKNNKSLNYNISNDYNELFIEYIDAYK
jgi:hypothetical protein